MYYGPGLGGKTTSLQHMHRVLKPDNRGQLISLATGIDRTLYFDFLPVKLPKIKGFSVRMSLYTVPGQVHYDATRKLVLQGADGVVFVADSQVARHEANIESIENLRENLRIHGMNADTVPLVIQYNKRDVPNILTVAQLESDLNQRGVPHFETCALSGVGVFEALKEITKLVLADLRVKGIYGKDRSSSPPPPEDDADAPVEVYETAAPPPRAAAREQSAIVDAIESHMKARESETPAAPEPEGRESAATALSRLWKPGAGRDLVVEMERHIATGEHAAAVRLAEPALRALVDDASGPARSLAESLLALGTCGGHYVRFQRAIALTVPTLDDALFCAFFLTDVELRMQAAGVRVVG
ncbi:MAG: GTPase domain-containing protein [Proteobacteria bacterium]|nr:GTPase domain-containing protein [Pseudomonadota bacterium]